MMWLFFAVVLVFARHADCGALKCSEGNSCGEEEESKASPIQLTRNDLENDFPWEQECQPGTEWESNCHSCKCSTFGRAECVKQDTCEKKVYESPLRCKPNSTFKKDCNTCVCLQNGLGLCTLMACVKRTKREAEVPSGKECAVGSSWKSQCNQCFCRPSGMAVCTLMGCLDDNEPIKSCAPGTVWKNDCNTCRCSSTGQAYCTLMGCSNNRAKREAVFRSGMQCAPGSSWMSQCNHCFCDPDGIAECTLMGCFGDNEPDKSCAPGTVWKNDCNTCTCSSDGQAYCTLMGCSNNRAKREAEVPSGMECAPGSSWRSQCNQCFCGPSGIAACTLKGCFGDNEPIKSCAPGTVWKNDCNTCTCSSDGQAYCTRKGCSNNRAKREAEVPSGMECAPGSSWRSQCNQCFCGPSGIAACTLKGCFGDNEPDKSCAPGTVWKNDCNTCTCSSDGQAYCTRKGCSNNRAKREAEVPSGMECAPGSSWRSQCNQCFCGPSGIAACTLKGCFGDNEPIKSCAPDTVWKNDCNTCRCSSTGQAYCTLIGCLHTRVNLTTGTERVKREDLPSSHSLTSDVRVRREARCQPGAEFTSECNVCQCSVTGRSITCTQNECLEGDGENSDVEVFQETVCQCNDIGTDYTCTNKPCPLPKDVEVFHELKETRSAVNTTKAVVCVANRMFIMDCNTCWCNDDGTSFYCTRRICTTPDEGDNENAQKVTQAKLTRKARAFQEPPKQCQPGQEFRLDCNKCLCDNEGQNFSCTRIDCNAMNNKHNPDPFSSARTKRDTTVQESAKCAAGSVFPRGCNVCRCTEEGLHAVCTMKVCRHDTDARAPEQDLGFRCNPGEQFANECNDCTCSADGKSVFCTLRLCDKDISPDI